MLKITAIVFLRLISIASSAQKTTYSADEPVAHADNGKIMPTGALSSFPYLPNEEMAALKNYYRNYGKFLWGEYGFYDSFSP